LFFFFFFFFFFVTNKFIFLLQNWHPEHFTCAICKEPLLSGSFYQHEGKPYCENDYIRVFVDKCDFCSEGLIGQFVETQSGKKYHPPCYEQIKTGSVHFFSHSFSSFSLISINFNYFIYFRCNRLEKTLLLLNQQHLPNLQLQQLQQNQIKHKHLQLNLQPKLNLKLKPNLIIFLMKLSKI